MTATYEIRIKSPAGVQQERLVGASGPDSTNLHAGFISLSYTKAVNEIGNGLFTISADSGAMTSLAPQGDIILDAQIEIWRRDDDEDIAPYCDFYGLLRDHEFSTDDNGTTTYIASLEEQSDLLRRAIVAYRAGIVNRSLFAAVPAETILKTLVTYNATAAGTTADRRDANVDSWGAFVSVASDSAGGATITRATEGRLLYEVVQEVARLGNLDFSLVKTGARAWEFRTAALLGTDRSSEVVFSLPYGNMRRPSLRSNRRGERTRAIVGGSGDDNNRPTVTRTGTNYDATVNSYEVFVNASDQSTTAGLNSAGDERLEMVRARDTLSFGVIQVPSTLYGKHYFFGDKVSAYYLGFTYTPQIARVSVDVRERGKLAPEQIQVSIKDE